MMWKWIASICTFRKNKFMSVNVQLFCAIVLGKGGSTEISSQRILMKGKKVYKDSTVYSSQRRSRDSLHCRSLRQQTQPQHCKSRHGSKASAISNCSSKCWEMFPNFFKQQENKMLSENL